ncbi:MAG: DUF4197 domain-containing protein [Chromatiales bacterium]|nr:DUF4197 domain-containing protein [Chromatiales bacterium]
MRYVKMAFSVLALTVSLSAQAGLKDLLNSAKEYTDSTGLIGDNGSSLSSDQIVAGLKEALNIGAEKAVALLGQEGGFLNDPQVKIPLPNALETVAKGLRAVGQEELADDFIATMNSAAEQAVPETLSIFSDAIRDMTLSDARGILAGGDTAATDYFRQHSSDELMAAIQPIVKQATERSGVTVAYKSMLGGLGGLSRFIGSDSVDLDSYVTEKTVQGLFVKLESEEKKIRENPAARTTDLLKSVFGSLSK